MSKKKIHKLFSGRLNVIGIADDSLISGLDERGKDHDKILENVLWICRKANLNLNSKCPFRCISTPHVWSHNITAWCESRLKQNLSTNGHVTTKDEERAAIIPGYTELPKYIFASDCRCVRAIMQAVLNKNWLDKEQNVQRSNYEKAKQKSKGMYAWSSTMQLGPYTWRMMHLVLALELDYYR